MIYALDAADSRKVEEKNVGNSLTSNFTEQNSSENSEDEVNLGTEIVSNNNVFFCSKCKGLIERSVIGNLEFFYCDCPDISEAFYISDSDDDISN